MRAALALLLCVGVVLSGCASYTEHLLEPDHPWHSWPAWTGGGIGWLAFFPLAAMEDVLTGSRNISPCPDYEGFGLLGSHFAAGLIWVFGTPFYALGLPFEHAAGGGPDPPPVPAEFREPASPSADPPD